MLGCLFTPSLITCAIHWLPGAQEVFHGTEQAGSESWELLRSLSCCLQSGVCLGGVLIAFLCDLSERPSFLPAQFLDVQREGNIF